MVAFGDYQYNTAKSGQHGRHSKERAIDAALRDGHVDIVILGAGLSGVGAACVDRPIRFGCPLVRAS
jgi:hypothetical protein